MRTAFALVLLLLATGGAARAHPMGNFSVSHYARIQAGKEGLRVRYLLDLAEVPTSAEMRVLDADADGRVSRREEDAYLARREPVWRQGVSLTADGRALRLGNVGRSVRVVLGAGGLPTLRIALEWRAPVAGTRSYAVVHADHNFGDRDGWNEVIVVGGPDAAVRDSTAPETDFSRELTDYPPLPTVPQDLEARFTVVPGVAAAPARERPLPGFTDEDMPGAASRDDALTRFMGRRELTPALMLLGLGLAFVFGGFHALSPGHGKAMVAAYLVGSRGTPRHALILGITVTITHTLGVFALGLLTLFASAYVVPEKLYLPLSLVSSLSICAVGGWLLYARTRALRRGDTHATHDHAHGDAHHHHETGEHEHTHDHGHTHDHDHEHTHDHGDGHAHSHLPPEGAVTMRTLLALGVSGGIVPCPSALVALLAAVALNRVLYGVLFISAFSLGLAAVLTGIGLAVVSANRWIARVPGSPRFLAKLSVAGAAGTLLIGLALTAHALRGWLS